jgi:hypothetical protein
MHEPDERHLSDEQLSAYLDGEEVQGPLGALDLEAHLAGCARCSDRIEALREVSTLVATPVEPVAPEVRAAAVAAAVHPGVDEIGVLERLARTKPARLRRQRFVAAGAVAAAVVLAVALPLGLSGHSSPTSVAARHGSERSRPTNSNPANSKSIASGSAVSPAGASAVAPTTTATLLDLGAVSSLKQVDQRLQEAGISGASPALGPLYRAEKSPAVSPGCVEDTRRAAHGGAFGPGVVASATYRGSRVLVMEFWATASAPPAGETVVALSAEDGCRLVARGTT